MSKTPMRRASACATLVLIVLSGCVVWTTSKTKTFPIKMTQGAADSANAEIMAVMQQSAQAWTHGDLDRFVAFYDSSAATTFIGRKGIVRGPAAIKEGYAPRFAPGAMHDSLSFENVEIDLIALDAANVIAYYKLMRGDSTIARGPTSLVMRKRANGWKITHDHSS